MNTKNVRINKEARNGDKEWIKNGTRSHYVIHKPDLHQWWEGEKNLNMTLRMESATRLVSGMSVDEKALVTTQNIVADIDATVVMVVDLLKGDPFAKKNEQHWNCTNSVARIKTFADVLYWRKAYPTVTNLGATTVWPANHSIKAYTGYALPQSIRTSFTLRPTIPALITVALERAEPTFALWENLLALRRTKQDLKHNLTRLENDEIQQAIRINDLKNWPTDEWTANEAALNEWLDNKPAFLEGEPIDVAKQMNTHRTLATSMEIKQTQADRATESITRLRATIAQHEAVLAEQLGGEEE